MSNSYLNSVAQVIEEKKNNAKGSYAIKLAEVTAVSSGRAIIKFDGETSAATKNYASIDQYFPAVGDRVAVLPQGNTYILLGKIINAAPVAKWAAANHNHAGVYAPADHNHDDVYSKLNHEHEALNRGSLSIGINSSYDFAPSNNNSMNLGSSSHMFAGVYAGELRGSRTNERLVFDSGTDTLKPYSANVLKLGTQQNYFSEVFAEKITGHHSNLSVGFSSASGYALNPDKPDVLSLGTSYYTYKSLYVTDAYVNGTAVTSDRRKKKSIKDLTKPYIEFFKKLRPRSYKYRNGTSGRIHTGFIAQEVEAAAHEAGLDNSKLAAVVIDEDGNYSLRYDELIAIQTSVIQDLLARVERLEREVNHDNTDQA